MDRTANSVLGGSGWQQRQQSKLTADTVNAATTVMAIYIFVGQALIAAMCLKICTSSAAAA